jgi:putative aldouronate transport system permease protein
VTLPGSGGPAGVNTGAVSGLPLQMAIMVVAILPILMV